MENRNTTEKDLHTEYDYGYKFVYLIKDKLNYDLSEKLRKKALKYTIGIGLGLSAITAYHTNNVLNTIKPTSYILHEMNIRELKFLNNKPKDETLENKLTTEILNLEKEEKYITYVKKRQINSVLVATTLLSILGLSALTLKHKMNKDKYSEFQYIENQEGTIRIYKNKEVKWVDKNKQ